MSDQAKKYDAETLARMAHEFIHSDFGQHYMAALGLQYNKLHQEAEDEWHTIEQKALKIERAAGLKMAINMVTRPDTLLTSGFYDKKREKPAKQ